MPACFDVAVVGGGAAGLTAAISAARAGRTVVLCDVDMRPALTPAEVPSDPPVEPDGTPAAYGFGWFLNPWKGHARMWHYGETVGFRTAIHRFPGAGLTVVVLANRSDLNASALALQVAAIFLSKES